MTSAGDRPDEVAAEVIEQIKRGDAPWQKPWKPGVLLKPRRFTMRFELEDRDEKTIVLAT